MSAIELQSVGKNYGPTPVLGSIDLTVPAGSKTVIVGSSGSGKTTLLRLLSGFEFPDAGSIRIGGVTVAGPGVAVPAHRRGIGHVAQDGALFPHLTVGENVAFGLERHQRADRRAIVAELLELVSLEDSLWARRPDELSGGQQQRVALARALARKPSVMLLDEPFSALDTGLRSATRDLVSGALTAAGITTVLVTHDRAEALSFGDQVAMLREGRLAQVGTPGELYSHPADLATARFLGDVVALDGRAAGGEVTCALGTFPGTGSRPDGPCTVVLRPEQLAVERAGRPGPAGAGVILAVEFQGSTESLSVALDAVPGHPVRIPVPGGSRFVPGERVTVRPVGPAAVFPAA